MKPKILIGCPTYDGQEYCLDRFVDGLKSLNYLEADILFVDNSETDNYSEKLRSLKIGDRRIEVIKDASPNTRIDRIISSRNFVRKYFLENDYKYLFFLDTDIIPPKDAIQKLLRADSDIASGVYLCRQKIEGKHHVQPAIYKPHGDDSVVTVTRTEVEPNKMLAIAVCGMGCCLIRRKVVENVSFRALTDSTTGGEDVAFCIDARKKGAHIVANTEVKCDHIGRYETLDFKPDFSFNVSVD